MSKTQAGAFVADEFDAAFDVAACDGGLDLLDGSQRRRTVKVGDRKARTKKQKAAFDGRKLARRVKSDRSFSEKKTVRMIPETRAELERRCQGYGATAEMIERALRELWAREDRATTDRGGF